MARSRWVVSSGRTERSFLAGPLRIFGQHSLGRADLILVLGIVALAAALRLWRLDYGLPQFLFPDETKYIRLATNYLKDHRVSNPHYFLNPPAFSHVVLATVALLDTLSVPIQERHQLVMVSRFLSALFGTASVWLLFLVGKELSGRKVGLAAASFLAVNFMGVRSSHQGVNDMMMLFLLLLSVYCFVRGASGGIGASKLHRGLVLAAFLGGIGVSTKYNGAIGLLPLAAFVLLRWGRCIRTGPQGQQWPSILREAGVLSGLLVAGLLAGNPWILVTPQEVWGGFLAQVDVASECWPGQELTPMSLQVARALAQASGIPILLLSVSGLVPVARGRHLALQLITVMTLVYLTYFAFLSHALFARFLIPALPGLCLLAAIGVDLLDPLVTARLRTVLFVGLVGLSLSQPLFNSLRYLWIISHPDTRTFAAQWAAGHVPSTSNWYYLFRKDVLSLQRLGFRESRPARLTSDGKFERGYYLVTSFDIREGCANLLDIRVEKATRLLFQQGVIVYHDNPAPGYSGPPIHENVYSPYYELGRIDRGGPEIWIIEIKG